MKTILFQGDSITDVGRNRERNDMLGWGYPRLVEAQLGFDHPGVYNFQNRGIGGNRILDLYARIVKDILNIAPDYLSILIGVNDIWHGLDDANGTGIQRFEKVYDMLLTELQEELPDTKIMIMEPFVLRGPATDNREDQPDRWELFSSGVYQVAAIVKGLAEKHGVKFIPLQKKFNEAEKLAPATYWLFDGVHPSAKGHELIKRQWLKAFNEIK
ncbi:MAG: SGNH/GDSL hydrolase family protein [Oscillospiraceae bacterium]|nr:SGNH/GDSL hydrolase family protein [Oscillospiraceae bacterium]